jgi:hypothetical protein
MANGHATFPATFTLLETLQMTSEQGAAWLVNLLPQRAYYIEQQHWPRTQQTATAEVPSYNSRECNSKKGC